MKLLQQIHEIDIRLIQRLMALPNRQTLASWSRLISRTGDGYFAIGMAIWLLYYGEYSWFKALALAYVLERAIYFLFKYGFRRSRPAQAIEGFAAHIEPADQYSFPSGHTSSSFICALFMSFLFPFWTIAFFFWACLVAGARMMLGLHFPSDIAAGAVAGMGFAWVGLSIYIL